jgi:transcriptional repressor OPI1
MRKLTDVRKDIVHTIRQVVDVVSKYTGGALPEPARGRVRGFILKLPQRWASKAGSGGGATGGGLALVEREKGRERKTVAAATGTGTGALRRPGGQRRMAQREYMIDGVRSGASSRTLLTMVVLSIM